MMNWLMTFWRTVIGFRARGMLAKTHAGQSMVEYAIMAALIAVTVMGAVQALGGGVGGVFQRILGAISGIG